MAIDFESFPDVGQCQSLTLAKTRCRYTAEPFLLSCTRHSDEEDLKLARLVLRAWRKGYRHGRQEGADDLEKQIELLKREIRELQRSELRMMDGKDQVVECENGLAYRWIGESDLKVGDQVLVPPDRFGRQLGFKGEYPTAVSSLGTRYPGYLKTIVARRGVTL